MKFKAAVLHSWGNPFSLEEVDLEGREGWTWLRVKATGVCGRDRVVWRGGFRNLRTPLILGHEVYGEAWGRPHGVYPAIEAACNGSTCTLLLGETTPGGYAEMVNVPASSLVELPSREYEKYAAAVCGVATMIHASKVAGLGPGDRVLVTGSLGGVGVHGIQYLAMLGARVYAYTRRRQHSRLLEDLGVEPVHSLDFYRGMGRVDVVMELVGARTLNESMRSLRQGGSLVLVGNVGGEPILIERPALLVMREIRIMGTAAYTMEEYREAINLVARGRVRPFYKAYRLEEVNRAYRDIDEGRVIGRAVLVTDSPAGEEEAHPEGAG
ncbi:MAG: zinc-binding dehydrogenase [Desulfurococcales archaeon]|nr:zinc-binding dehydrogenase [Desulfurococcales archaeon]